MASEYDERKRLTFEQAEGAEALPSQLKLKEVSPELRAPLWRVFYNLLQDTRVRDLSGDQNLEGEFLDLLNDWHVTHCFRAADEFTSTYDDWLEELKSIFMGDDYIKIFGFVQWVLRHGAKPYNVEIEVDDALRKSRAAYALFDNDTIIPIGSDASDACQSLA